MAKVIPEERLQQRSSRAKASSCWQVVLVQPVRQANYAEIGGRDLLLRSDRRV